MSKINLEKVLSFSDRIVKVLIDKGIVHKRGKKKDTPNYSAAERMCGMKGTVLQKAVKREGGLYDDNLDKFLGTFHVSREWLVHGKGDTYVKNGTSGRKEDTLDAKMSELQDEHIRLLREKVVMLEKEKSVLLKELEGYRSGAK
jgi:hypothetical protein